MAVDPIKDWIIGGRHGTQKNYDEGYDRTFGERDIFWNLADKGDERKTVDAENREE